MSAQVESSQVDTFRQMYLNSIEYCEPIPIEDTIQFLKQGLYSLINFDYTSSFSSIFFCYEEGYMNLPDPDRRKYPIEELNRIRDIRWVFLLYLNRYILPIKHVDPINKFCKVTIKQSLRGKDLFFVKICKRDSTPKEVEMWDEGSSDNLIKIYKKLIKLVNRKNFSLDQLRNHNQNLLESIGYELSIEKMKAKW